VVTVVGVLCLVGVVVLLTNPVNSQVLHRLDGGPGTNPDVYTAASGKAFVIVLNIFGALAVFGVALYSAWQLYKRRGSPRLVTANVVIALGTYIISQAGGMARTGHGSGLFWLTMTIGWIVLFGGFLLTFTVHRESAASIRQPAQAAPA
jgi:cation transport ATPase